MSEPVKKGLVELVFVGGKHAPANPYRVGQVYELPPRYARFPWFKLKNAADATKVPAPVAKPAPKVEAGKTEEEQAEDAFAEHLAAEGLAAPVSEPEVNENVAAPEIAETAEAPFEAQTRSQLEKMTKEELVQFITDKGGVADMSLLKATLVETALTLSKSS